jgi:hypothetical protein
MTTTAKSTPAKRRTKPVIELGADLSPAVAAIEAAVRMFTKKFPDTPPVTIVVKRDERAWGHTTVAKVWGPSKAKATAATRFEIMISGENLRRGAEAVAATLLHELAHARNLSKGVLDTDTNGRHNVKFKTTAEGHGLAITEVGWHGWTGTDWTPEGKVEHKAIIDTIARGLAKSAAVADADLSHLPGAKGTAKPKPGTPGAPGGAGVAVAPPKRGNRNLLKASCKCGHSIRVSKGVLDTAVPTCSVCNEPFAVAEAGA